MSVDTTLEARVGKLETNSELFGLKLQQVNDDGRATRARVEAIDDKLDKRPSWAVTTYITIATSGVVGLAAAWITAGAHH